MGLHRYYIEQRLTSGRVSLSPEEAVHALRVRRETIGNRCVVFDGHGNESIAVIAVASKRECELELEKIVFAPRDLPGHFTLGVALPKGDRLRSVIERAVELGVHVLVPILTDRSVKIPSDNTIDKLQRIVLEACKQCERNRLMEIRQPIRFSEWVGQVASGASVPHPSFRIIAHPDLPEHRITMQAFAIQACIEKPPTGFAAIGPEGGFTDDEVLEAVSRNWKVIDLGARILRVETAVASLATLASVVFNDQQVARQESYSPNKPNFIAKPHLIEFPNSIDDTVG